MIIGVGNDQFTCHDVWDEGPEFPEPSEVFMYVF